MFKLLVGLGNPGPEYEDTRHNAGWWWLDRVAADLRVTLHPERSYFGLVGRTQVQGQPLWLLKPTTYMNRSGQAVAALARFFKVAPHEILVAHDELDLPPGDARLKRGGGHAGHNGLRDIHAQLGSADYWRLRLGIGHPGVKAEVVHWVLRKPPLEHRQAIDTAIDRAARALPLLLAGDVAKATSLIHTTLPPRPKPPRPPEAPGGVPG
ncbi:MAG: aminoacyl-tRNA hydrolase [Tepidimonas ignava]|uniref:aminoacyl-tRNA hydrolase n=1 Tax=Tepidimonas ignava TaxID=114249 RepID=UPI00391B8294